MALVPVSSRSQRGRGRNHCYALDAGSTDRSVLSHLWHASRSPLPIPREVLFVNVTERSVHLSSTKILCRLFLFFSSLSVCLSVSPSSLSHISRSFWPLERSCVCFCLNDPFNCISFHKYSRQLFAFSFSSSGLIFLPYWPLQLSISLYESLPQP